jgi:hypothetical protein
MHWYRIPEWWLCILGLPTLVFVGWQSWETRKAAQATRESAISVSKQSVLMEKQAAQMEAQTKELSRQNRNILHAERAWVVESIKFLDDIPRRQASGGGVMTALVTFKNIGRQPAFLKLLQTRFQSSERLPDNPEFRTSETISDGFMLAPDQELFVRVMLEEGSFDDDQVDRIQGAFGKKPLYLSLPLWVHDLREQRCARSKPLLLFLAKSHGVPSIWGQGEIRKGRTCWL